MELHEPSTASAAHAADIKQPIAGVEDSDNHSEVFEAVESGLAGMSEQRQRRELSHYTRRRGGLRHDRLRRLAWPILLGSSSTNMVAEKPHDEATQTAATEHVQWTQLPQHRDEGQVRLDVDRSFIFYPTCKTESELDRLKNDLFEVIIATLRSHPKLCYFQGFHDIVQVLLLVLGKERAFDAVTRVSLLRLRDFMLPSLSSSLAHLELLPAIMAAADPALAQHVSHTKPFFALAATLTLFAHDVESYSEIARVFDFLLAEEAFVAIYLFASIVLSRRDELLDIPAEDEDILSFTLSKIPKALDIEAVIQRCISLVEAHPPETLPRRAWARISPQSVLKTTGDGHLPKLEEAEVYLDAQLAQQAWQKHREKALSTLWAYRKPLGGVSLAVLVAVMSVWLQKGPGLVILSYATQRMMALSRKLLSLAHS